MSPLCTRPGCHRTRGGRWAVCADCLDRILYGRPTLSSAADDVPSSAAGLTAGSPTGGGRREAGDTGH